MNYNCEMIRDLLPLYVDKVCSPASAAAVEEHIRECNACASLLGEMSTADPLLDKEIYAERSRVLDTQAKFFKRRSAVAGCIIGGIFVLPTIGNPALYFLALAIGSVVGTMLLMLLKKPVEE